MGRKNRKDKWLVVGPGGRYGIKVSWRPKVSLLLVHSSCRRKSKFSYHQGSSKLDRAATGVVRATLKEVCK